jgi:hypothetical protein
MEIDFLFEDFVGGGLGDDFVIFLKVIETVVSPTLLDSEQLKSFFFLIKIER